KIQDSTLADAILDRIVHDSLRLTLKGESMRKLTSHLHTQNHQGESRSQLSVTST
ncbi:MAG: ATP-binding protein, partial [Cyanobacteria bacterium P01_D01_bin.56]